jgi:hypothetical protein
MIKEAYVQYTPGHKNSKGEPAPWTIRDHETGEILQSYKTKEEAEKALKRMKYFKHKEGKTVRENIRRIARLLREAAKELENETYKRKTILSRKIGKFDSDPENLEVQNEKTEAFLKKFDKIYQDTLSRINNYYGHEFKHDKYGYNYEYDYESGWFYIPVRVNYKSFQMMVEEDVREESEEFKRKLELEELEEDEIDWEEEIYKRLDEISSRLSKLIDKLLDNIEQVMGPKSVRVAHEDDDGFVIAIYYPVLADIHDAIEEMKSLEINGKLTATNIMNILQDAADFTVARKENWYEELIEKLKSFCRETEKKFKKAFDLIHDFEDSLYEELII